MDNKGMEKVHPHESKLNGHGEKWTDPVYPVKPRDPEGQEVAEEEEPIITELSENVDLSGLGILGQTDTPKFRRIFWLLFIVGGSNLIIIYSHVHHILCNTKI